MEGYPDTLKRPYNRVCMVKDLNSFATRILCYFVENRFLETTVCSQKKFAKKYEMLNFSFGIRPDQSMWVCRLVCVFLLAVLHLSLSSCFIGQSFSLSHLVHVYNCYLAPQVSTFYHAQLRLCSDSDFELKF